MLIAATTAAALFMITGVSAVLAGRARPAELMAYTAYYRISAEIYLLDVGHAIRRNLTDSPDFEADPFWSPDGRHFAFVSDRDGGTRIYALDTFTGRSWMLTPPHGSYHSLRWVDGGARLLLQTGLNEQARLFSVHWDGSNFVELTSETVTAGSLVIDLGLDQAAPPRTLSADGRLRLITRYADSSWGLYVVEDERALPANSGQRLADLGRAFAEAAGWSPDGRYVYYVSTVDGSTDLYVTTLDGAARRLTHDAAIESGPVWRPVVIASGVGS